VDLMAERDNIPGAGAPRADFSDVQSGSSTTAPPTQPAPAAARSYTVESGDTLSKIAKRELGDAGKWRVIFEANRDTIKDPDLIHPGQVLAIPSDA
jgi:nucleoid-associated protein YgaU